MRIFFYFIVILGLFTGCTNYTFEPKNKAPQNEHEKLVQAQQHALQEQQNSVLNN